MNELLVTLPAGNQITLQKGKTIIGRNSNSDISLSDMHVSGTHCEIYRKGYSFFIKDLASTNGTFVNGNRIADEVKLKNNDTISLGQKTAAFQFRGELISFPLLLRKTRNPFFFIPVISGCAIIIFLLLYFLVFMNMGKIDIRKEIQRLQEVHGPGMVPQDQEIMTLIEKTTEQVRNDPTYGDTLKKKQNYAPIVDPILKNNNLSTDFSYIIWAESHFNPFSQNQFSGARGMWQLMPATARHYGLIISKSVDERMDPKRSTEAAALYLNDISSIFGKDSFLLILAAYNAGDGAIVYALKQINNPDKDRTFWYLYKNNLIPAETKSYVLKILALMIISYSE
ncbi:MAG: transglycosylase SLT domain-containing protein [Spirochaetales bacterium]|nr:transglycosylase SLT domain-containing protein [Spirochaetales bacterium]